jgi:DNA repair exonuclease SbcCD nuclease subunit
MKVVHFADLHLDAQFAWLAATPELARERRQSLRDTLRNIIKLARDEKVDAVFCAGDLFEHERVTPDTTEFLRKTFAEIDPLPIYIAPGNHDWMGPRSLYEQVAWSGNVHVFHSAQPEAVELAEGLTLWGAAHRAPANTRNFFEGFSVDRSGVNIGLFHASENSWRSAQETGKVPHAPFDASEIANAGLDFAFLGHFHMPRIAQRHAYPGNPDPLSFGETGERGALLATIHPDGKVNANSRRVSTSSVSDVVVNVTGATTVQDIRGRVGDRVAEADGFVRLTLEGELTPEVEFHVSDLNTIIGPRVQVRIGALHPGYDISAIKDEQTIRGQFVREVLADTSMTEERQRRVLLTGLRALDGRTDLEVNLG